MKREIDCLACAKRWSDIPDYAGEARRRVDGTLGVSCVCDGCGTELPAGTRAAAITVWVGDRLNEPGRWEPEYFQKVSW